MGVHERKPHPKRLPPVARLRPAHALVAVAVDRPRERRRDSAHRRLLHPTGAHVRAQLRAGGLGYPRARPVAAPPSRRCPACRLVLRHLDFPNPHVF